MQFLLFVVNSIGDCKVHDSASLSSNANQEVIPPAKFYSKQLKRVKKTLSASLNLVTPQLLPYTEPANVPMLVDASAETPLCSSAKTHLLATDPDETPLIVVDLDTVPVHRAKAVPPAADPDPAVADVDPVDAAEALPPAADPVDTEVMDAAAVSPTATLALVIRAAIAAPMTDEFFDSQLYSSCCSCGNCMEAVSIICSTCNEFLCYCNKDGDCCEHQTQANVTQLDSSGITDLLNDVSYVGVAMDLSLIHI